MEKFQETHEKWSDINVQLYKDSLEYLEGVVEKAPNKCIEIDTDEQPTIVYYGRHPEYDANPFSCVDRVYDRGGNLYVSCEETDEYPLDEISAEEVWSIAHAVCASIKNNKG